MQKLRQTLCMRCHLLIKHNRALPSATLVGCLQNKLCNQQFAGKFIGSSLVHSIQARIQMHLRCVRKLYIKRLPRLHYVLN